MAYKKFTFFITVFVLTALLAACIVLPPPVVPGRASLFQTSTLSALEAGMYDGKLTVGELKQQGDFGLGTFNALDGEMVVIDGQVYQAKDDGHAYLAHDDMQTPFAAVTFFEPDRSVSLNDSLDCSQLEEHLDSLLPTVDAPYAIRVSGTFASLKVRAPHKQSQPYPPLAEALADQAVFESHNASGDMVGLRLPDYMSGVNAAGYHFHFISQDRRTGGHVLDCQAAGLSVEIDAIDQVRLEGLQTGAFQPAQTSTSVPTAAPQPIVLGALYNLTGAQASLDIPSSQGAQLAVDEANRAGGVLGRPVQLVVEDGQSNPSVVAQKTAEILAQYPDVVAFLGLSDTDMVLAAAPVAAEHGRLFLTSGATSPLLPAQVPGWLFLACFGDNVQAAAAAEWAYADQSARTASILFDQSASYTRLLQGYFATRFEELGGQILSRQTYTTGDTQAMTQAIGQLSHADIIFVSAGPQDAPEASRLLRAAGFTEPILGGDGFDSGALWQKYAELGDIFFTTHAYLGADNPDPLVQAFRAAYSAAYPSSTPDAFAALGYDAARLLMQAITDAGSAAPQDVKQALAGIQNFQGVTGVISYAPGNPIPIKTVTILEVQHGNYKFISQIVPKSVPAP